MAQQELSAGLYLVKQYLPEKGVTHFGILDVGNRCGLPDLVFGSESVVIHQPPSGLRVDWLSNTGSWNMVQRLEDEPGAIARINEAARNSKYDLFANNCEHFANFVTSGERRSPQLTAWVFASLGLCAAIWMISSTEKAA